jgi:hypothetical protein
MIKTVAGVLFSTLLANSAIAQAADEEATKDREECKQQEREAGVGEKTGAVACAIKSIFQSRIRRKKETEPVDMTVGPPPMRLDDSDTPGPNNWETNVALNTQRGGGERRTELPSLDINYGIGDTLQVNFTVPYVFARQQEGESGALRPVNENGFGDSQLGLKYRFYDDKESGLSFAIAPTLQFETPGANRSVSEGRTIVVLPVIMTREFSTASITANAGVEASSQERRYFAGFGVGTRLSTHLALLAEIVGTDLNAAEEKRALFNVGLRWKVSDSQSLAAAFGRDVYAGGDQHRQTYFTFVYQKLFGS